jgi:hypothetical protein
VQSIASFVLVLFLALTMARPSVAQDADDSHDSASASPVSRGWGPPDPVGARPAVTPGAVERRDMLTSPSPFVRAEIIVRHDTFVNVREIVHDMFEPLRAMGCVEPNIAHTLISDRSLGAESLEIQMTCTEWQTASPHASK